MTLTRQVSPEKGIGESGDEGDGVIEMMIKPGLNNYDSRDSGKADEADEDL